MKRSMFFCLLFPIFLAACQTPFVTSATGPMAVSSRVSRCPDTPLTDKIVAESINMSVEKLADLRLNRSVTNENICSMSEEKYVRLLAKFQRPMPDHPGDWASFRELQRSGSDGLVQPDGLIKGLEQRRELLATQSLAEASPFKGDITQPMAGINANRWISIGPGNVGGRIRAIAVHPAAPSTIFVGSVSGGIWKTIDSGASWNPVNDFMGNISISSIVFDPTNPNVMYAGTGEGFYNTGAVRGYGVFKSLDGGSTWNHLSATLPSSDTGNSANSWYYVNRLVIALDGTLLAATGYSSNGRIWRSADGGATWSSGFTGRIRDIRFDPNSSTRALASAVTYNYTTYQFDTAIVRSTDSGQSWTVVKTFANSQGRIELAYTKADSQIVYASRETNFGEIWRSADGGGSWTLVSTPAHLGGQGWYDNSIWVDPTNPAHLIAGGIVLYSSSDSGVTWTLLADTSAVHPDHHSIVADPGYNGSSNRRVYFGNDGGIYKAEDINAVTSGFPPNGWTGLNNNLFITQFYGASGSAATGRVYGGTQDNGTLLQPVSGTSWSNLTGGDGGYTAVDTTGSYLFSEYPYLSLYRFVDGTGLSSISSGMSDAEGSANFIAPFILDPNNDSTLLAGGNFLWRSSNAKATVPTWSSIKIQSTAYISAISVREGDSALIWVGHNDGTLYKSQNGTVTSPTWTVYGKGTGSAFTPARMVTRILVDKTTPNTVYVSYGGYAADNLYKTTDGGSTWSSIHGTIPAVPIFSITRHPTIPTWLYAGTEVGLFTSMDGGATWQTINDGPANVEISELFWLNSSTLVAASHGRGVFKTTVTSVDANPPVAMSDSYTAGFNWPLNVSSAGGVLANDTDLQGLPLTARVIVSPSHSQSFTLYPNGSFSYIPVQNYSGSDSFTYKANDGINESGAATVTITVSTNTVPGAPTALLASGGFASASVSFTAPANGGSPILDYTVTVSPGGLKAVATVSPITISGLTNGIPYSFTVTARNAIGSGPASASSATVTPDYPAGTTIWSQNFDTVTVPLLPAGWPLTVVLKTGAYTPAWATRTVTRNPSGIAPHSSPNLVYLNTWDLSAGDAATLASPSFSLTGFSYGRVKFWMYRDSQAYGAPSTDDDRVQVYVNTAANLSGATLLGTVNRLTSLSPVVGASGWYEYSFDIPGSYSGGTNYIVFQGISGYGNDIHLDDISVLGSVTPSLNVRIGGISYGTVAAAYDAIADAGLLQLRDFSFSETLNFNRSIAFTLKGGYDVSFSGSSGYSTLIGALTITSGTVTMDSIVLQ